MKIPGTVDIIGPIRLVGYTYYKYVETKAPRYIKIRTLGGFMYVKNPKRFIAVDI